MNCVELHAMYDLRYEVWIVWNHMKYMIYGMKYMVCDMKCMNESNGMECNGMNGLERYRECMKQKLYALYVCGSVSLYGSLCYHSLSVVSHHNSIRVYVQVV